MGKERDREGEREMGEGGKKKSLGEHVKRHVKIEQYNHVKRD